MTVRRGRPGSGNIRGGDDLERWGIDRERRCHGLGALAGV